MGATNDAVRRVPLAGGFLTARGAPSDEVGTNNGATLLMKRMETR